MMINIKQSDSDSPNSALIEASRLPGENNAEWIRRRVREEDATIVALFGGTDPISSRIRIAQAYARHDVSPSHWSHAAILEKAEANIEQTKTWQVNLGELGHYGFPPNNNGVQELTLGVYKDPRSFPNVAVLHIPVTLPTVLQAVREFTKLRKKCDVPRFMIKWLAYVWGVDEYRNPLRDGLSIPSAAMVRHAFRLCDFDLSPGLVSDTDCPEAIWQAGRWWHGEYDHPIAGSYLIEQRK